MFFSDASQMEKLLKTDSYFSKKVFLKENDFVSPVSFNNGDFKSISQFISLCGFLWGCRSKHLLFFKTHISNTTAFKETCLGVHDKGINKRNSISFSISSIFWLIHNKTKAKRDNFQIEMTRHQYNTINNLNTDSNLNVSAKFLVKDDF